MKPRIFIGSSTEALDIAYIIQENLEYDGQVTVWTQGIFQLSSNTLDDLIIALKNFDFAIFVFKADDITQIRNQYLNTVRDNVIFELGLFVGKLGKEKVFFVMPNNTNSFHLPTDLLGVTPGKYNSEREDKNLKAALGPFCNQIRVILRKFTTDNLNGFENETEKAKGLALNKPDFWEYLLAAELIKTRLVSINKSYDELERGLIFRKTKKYRIQEFLSWFGNATTDITRIIALFKQVFEIEMSKSFGEPGVAGNLYEIKFCADKIELVCKELLSWEYDLNGINSIPEFNQIVEFMKGWTKNLIEEINKFPFLIEEAFKPENIAKSKTININLTFSEPAYATEISELMENVSLKHQSGEYHGEE